MLLLGAPGYQCVLRLAFITEIQPVNAPTHVCLATPSLAVGKAGGHSLLEDGVHQRLGCEPVGRVVNTTLTFTDPL